MIGLIRIDAPGFVAGAETDGDRIIAAASVLGNVVGKSAKALVAAAAAKGWKVEVLGPPLVDQDPDVGWAAYARRVGVES